MTDEVDCIRATSKGAALKAPPPDLVNCAERSILANKGQLPENDCKGIFGDAIVCNKSGTFKTSPLEKLNSMFHADNGKLRKRSEPLKSVMRPKFVKSASIARLLGNNYSTTNPAATTPTAQSPHKGEGQAVAEQKNASADNGAERKSSLKGEEGAATNNHSNSNNKRSVRIVAPPPPSANNGKKPEKFQKCSSGREVIEEAAEEDMEPRRVSFSSTSPMVADCAEELSLRGSHLNLMSHNSDIRTLRALRSLTKGLGKLLRRRTDSVEISPPDPEYKVSYLGNVLTGWAKGEGCFEKPLATLWRNYTQVQKPDVLMRIKVCPSGLKATTKQHGLTEYWSHRITYCSSPKNYPRVFCWIYRHEGRKMKHEMRCHAVLCSKEVVAKDICSQLQGNLFRALKEFKRDKISRQNARLSLANCVYDNPSMPRRKLMLSVGGNNYRPPLERSKSAPKLMAIEEADDEEDEEEDDLEEQYESARRRYPASVSLGRRSWLNRNSISVQEAFVAEEEEEVKKAVLPGESEPAGHEIDELVQENSFKLTPSISQYDDDEEEEEEDEDVEDYECRLGGAECDKEAEGLEGEIMSYFEKKLSERTGALSLDDLSAEQSDRLKLHNRSLDCIVDTDHIISHLIRTQQQQQQSPSRTPPTTSSLRSPQSLDHLTPEAAAEPDEPESRRYQLADLDFSDPASRISPSSSMESDEESGLLRVRYPPGKGLQLATQFSEESQLDLDLPKKRARDDDDFGRAADSDSDVSDESGFIEYQDHKYPINSDINKADNSILV